MAVKKSTTKNLKIKKTTKKKSAISSIPELLEDLKNGKMIILMDAEDRENEGDLVCAAEKITPEKINFMAKYGRGLICLALSGEYVEKLKLPLMTSNNQSKFGTAFTVSIEASKNVTTGISARDRATTILTAISDNYKDGDIVSPGHIFPLKAVDGGVLVRAGQTEGSVDLAQLAGLKSAAVICEIMNDDGTMARYDDLKKFSKKHKLKIGTISDLIEYRRRNEKLIMRSAEANLPTEFGDFKIIIYKNKIDNKEHIALVKGEIFQNKPILVRVHSECLTGDIFFSKRCDCNNQLHSALQAIQKADSGILLYMRQEGRGIGLENKIKVYYLQEKGYDTVEANEALGFPADLRDYGIGAQILYDLGVRKIKLITNNPKKIIGLQGYGLEVIERVPLVIEPNQHNKKYLKTKANKLGHLFNIN